MDQSSSGESRLGERLHSIFLDEWGLATRDFSHESVDRAMAALNAARAPAPPMGGEVLWLPPPIAFTLPGRHVYISRRFVERCATDAPVAFALAHEIGHHDLGHLKRAERWQRWLAAGALAHAPAIIALMAVELGSHLLYSRDRENAADYFAVNLCRKAGYDLRECLKCFDVLSWYSLDHNDFDGVYGQDEELELDPAKASGAIDRMRIEARLWVARHRRTHPSIHERRQQLLTRVSEIEETGYQPSPAMRQRV